MASDRQINRLPGLLAVKIQTNLEFWLRIKRQQIKLFDSCASTDSNMLYYCLGSCVSRDSNMLYYCLGSCVSRESNMLYYCLGSCVSMDLNMLYYCLGFNSHLCC